MEAYQIAMLVTSVLIIILLAIQSWILIKVMPLIRTTAHNSSALKKFGLGDILESQTPEIAEYPEALIKDGLLHCNFPHEKNHIHTQQCL